MGAQHFGSEGQNLESVLRDFARTCDWECEPSCELRTANCELRTKSQVLSGSKLRLSYIE